MRAVDSATLQAFYDAAEKGFPTRSYVQFTVFNDDDREPVIFRFSNDLDYTTVLVIEPGTFDSAPREYLGGGTLLQVDNIEVRTGFTPQRCTINLASGHPQVRSMIYGHDCNLGAVEVHKTILNPTTMRPVAAALVHFVGLIDDIKSRRDPSGGVSIECRDRLASELTRANFSTRSSEWLERTRGGDEFYCYLDVQEDIEILWGGE